jgi:hypothetical protein
LTSILTKFVRSRLGRPDHSLRSSQWTWDSRLGPRRGWNDFHRPPFPVIHQKAVTAIRLRHLGPDKNQPVVPIPKALTLSTSVVKQHDLITSDSCPRPSLYEDRGFECS